MNERDPQTFIEQQRLYARAIAEHGWRLFDLSAMRGEPLPEALGARAVLAEAARQQAAVSFDPSVSIEIVPERTDDDTGSSLAKG